MHNIVNRRYWYFGLSLLIIVPGVIALILWGLPLSIDFTGGSLLEVQFVDTSEPLDSGVIREAYAAQGLEDSIIQIAEGNIAVVRSQALEEDAQAAIVTQLEARYGPAVVLAAETVGPSVGAEIATRAGLAVRSSDFCS
jgi:preprotein translocase subunit SecF